jgi:four helix bundle protein
MGGDFTDLVAWQEAVALAADIAVITRQLRGPGVYQVCEQVRRAAESVPANIAEGYGRGHGRDFARFCRIAAASAAELESHLRVAVATGRLRSEPAEPVLRRCRRVRALSRGLALKMEGIHPARPRPGT